MCSMREAHAITPMKVGLVYHCLSLCELLQHLVEQLALIDIWHCHMYYSAIYIYIYIVTVMIKGTACLNV